MPFDCDGEWERNYDGFPEAICDRYHVRYARTCGKCVLKRLPMEIEAD